MAPTNHIWRIVLAAVVVCYAVVVLRTAWISDDALITFRTVDNFANGYGLRWNVLERVQTYTHPLWMLLLCALHAVTGELLTTAMIFALILSLGAIGVVIAVSRSAQTAAVIIATLALSQSFVDYSTSGLENALTNLLIALFAASWWSSAPDPRRLWWCAGVAALGLLNRLDLAIVFLPAIVAMLPRVGWKRWLGTLTVASLPLTLWLSFAFFYYGSPLPVTAYAKLSTGIARSELLAQGLLYYRETLLHDPITLVVIVAGAVVAWLGERSLRLPVGIGLLGYCAYVWWVGGDFMLGRFFAGPMMIAALLLARSLPVHKWTALAFIPLLVLGFVATRPTLLSGSDYDGGEVPEHGIADERGVYYQRSGLMSQARWEVKPDASGEILRAQGVTEPAVFYRHGVGFSGFSGGPLSHIVDPFLCDPLLTRLPIYGSTWRIGHFGRRLPEGFLEMHSGTGELRDPNLGRYYEKIRFVIRGPLWSGERLATALGLLTGRYDDWRDEFIKTEYVTPPVRSRQAHTVARRCRPRTPWRNPGVTIIYAGGLDVIFKKMTTAQVVELGLERAIPYLVSFRRGEHVLAAVETQPDRRVGGITPLRIGVPPPAQGGFDRVRIVPLKATDRVAAFGYLVLVR